MTLSRTFLFLLLFTFIQGTTLLAEYRTWNDSTGQFSVEAQFVKTENSEVVLRKQDGSTVNVPFSKLSKEDVRYVVSQDPFASLDSLESLARLFYTSVFDQMKRQNGHTTKAYLRARKFSSLAPESIQSALVALLISAVTPIVGLFLYIWLLKHEFRVSAWWGITQLVADLALSFLLPFIGVAVALLFGLIHAGSSKGPVIAYVIISLITLGVFFLIPIEVFEATKN